MDANKVEAIITNTSMYIGLAACIIAILPCCIVFGVWRGTQIAWGLAQGE